MTLLRMDNVSINVDDLRGAIAFFTELGMELEGSEMAIEGPWVDRIIALEDVRTDIAMMRTPDGHNRLELTKFHQPATVGASAGEPANTHGIRRIMFAVDDLDDTLERLRPHGAELVGEVVRFEDAYKLCYLRGPEGVVIALAEPLS